MAASWTRTISAPIVWISLVFGVGGTIFGLRQNVKWLLTLGCVALAGSIIALLYRAYQETAHANERAASETQRREEAEKRLNNVTSELVERIQEITQSHRARQVLEQLIEGLGFLDRMGHLQDVIGDGFEVRRIHTQAGTLFLAAILTAEQVPFIRPNDPFVLVKKGTLGLQSNLALVRLHQNVNLSTGTAFFRVERALAAGALELLATLAEAAPDLSSMSGFKVVMAVEGETYAGVESAWSRRRSAKTWLEDY